MASRSRSGRRPTSQLTACSAPLGEVGDRRAGGYRSARALCGVWLVELYLKHRDARDSGRLDESASECQCGHLASRSHRLRLEGKGQTLYIVVRTHTYADTSFLWRGVRASPSRRRLQAYTTDRVQRRAACSVRVSRVPGGFRFRSTHAHLGHKLPWSGRPCMSMTTLNDCAHYSTSLSY